MQMARAYAVFANGGRLVTPYLIDYVTHYDGQLLWRPPRAPAATEPVIDPRNAYIMTSMPRDVIRGGTGAGAGSLKRQEVGGKTGSTNNFVDAWFCGFTPVRARSAGSASIRLAVSARAKSEASPLCRYGHVHGDRAGGFARRAAAAAVRDRGCSAL